MSRIEIEPGIEVEMEARLEALPTVEQKQWTPHKEELLVKYWKTRPQYDVAKILGFSVRWCREKYKELTDEC